MVRKVGTTLRMKGTDFVLVVRDSLRLCCTFPYIASVRVRWSMKL